MAKINDQLRNAIFKVRFNQPIWDLEEMKETVEPFIFGSGCNNITYRTFVQVAKVFPHQRLDMNRWTFT